ncbi:MAG: methyltransferase domain-containing protein [Deltaproteobacteria bacterium]|nr:methyltransferase domain-containing protein [Deltaproteobacteria bacterium]
MLQVQNRIEPAQHEVLALETLRQGALISDKQFDRVYPLELRDLSHRHWTPVRVARRAASFLACTPDTRVLDVGSGLGKFCLVGALTTMAHYFGVEQRKSLADIATAVARQHGVSRAQFLNMNMAEMDWSGFQSFYFYNPFQEQVDPTARLDDSLPCSLQLCELYLALVHARLAAAPAGTRVAAYHGIGLGLQMPEGYELVSDHPVGTGNLQLWLKIQ